MSTNSRKALAVGIDHYAKHPLPSCVKGAHKMASLLSHHHNQEMNFHTMPLVSTPTHQVLRHRLLDALEELFAHEADVALFYFCGHAINTRRGGILATQDNADLSEGVLVDEVLALANQANIGEVVIFLD